MSNDVLVSALEQYAHHLESTDLKEKQLLEENKSLREQLEKAQWACEEDKTRISDLEMQLQNKPETDNTLQEKLLVEQQKNTLSDLEITKLKQELEVAAAEKKVLENQVAALHLNKTHSDTKMEKIESLLFHEHKTVQKLQLIISQFTDAQNVLNQQISKVVGYLKLVKPDNRFVKASVSILSNLPLPKINPKIEDEPPETQKVLQSISEIIQMSS